MCAATIIVNLLLFVTHKSNFTRLSSKKQTHEKKVKGSSPLLTFFLIMVANLQLSWDRKLTLKLDNLAESIVNS